MLFISSHLSTKQVGGRLQRQFSVFGNQECFLQKMGWWQSHRFPGVHAASLWKYRWADSNTVCSDLLSLVGSGGDEFKITNCSVFILSSLHFPKESCPSSGSNFHLYFKDYEICKPCQNFWLHISNWIVSSNTWCLHGCLQTHVSKTHVIIFSSHPACFHQAFLNTRAFPLSMLSKIEFRSPTRTLQNRPL